MTDNMDELDFVAIGDITTDAFIELKDARVNCEIDDKNCMLCVRFGDKIPYENVVVVHAVGNSPNASVSARRLGLKSALATNLGDDENGEDQINALKKEGVSCDYVKVHKGKESNYHYVLRYEAERTILVKHHEYEYSLPDFKTPPKWMYLSSLGENSLPFHHEIADYIKANSETKLAFQPGTFQMKLGYEKLKDIYEVSELFFCNKDEAQRILDTKEDDIKELLKGIHALGPKIAIITEGPDGANTYDGEEMWHMPMYPDPAPPVDRTGAGDSFASTFTSMLALDMSIPEALSRGPINSMSVTQKVGAQEGLLTKDKIEELLEKAPADYKATKIN
jgi:ribokinase